MSESKENKAEIIPAKPKALARLDEIQDAVKQESFEVVSAVVSFAEIEEGAAAPPESWIQKFGFARAMKRFRLAKAGWLGAKEAPIGIKVAASIAGNIIKAQGNDGDRRPLNMTFVKVTNTLPKYDAIEIEE